MSKFEFRLSTLLKLRCATRDERRRYLAEAMHADVLLDEQREKVADSIKEVREQFKPGLGAVDVDRLLDAQRYELLLRAEAQVLEKQKQMLSEEIERRRLVTVAADRDVRALELLRDKQAERHRLEESRREMKRIDEVASRRARRGDTA